VNLYNLDPDPYHFDLDPDWGKADPDPHHCNVGTYYLQKAGLEIRSRLKKPGAGAAKKYEAPVPAQRR